MIISGFKIFIVMFYNTKNLTQILFYTICSDKYNTNDCHSNLNCCNLLIDFR